MQCTRSSYIIHADRDTHLHTHTRRCTPDRKAHAFHRVAQTYVNINKLTFRGARSHVLPLPRIFAESAHFIYLFIYFKEELPWWALHDVPRGNVSFCCRWVELTEQKLQHSFIMFQSSSSYVRLALSSKSDILSGFHAYLMCPTVTHIRSEQLWPHLPHCFLQASFFNFFILPQSEVLLCLFGNSWHNLQKYSYFNPKRKHS